MVAMQTSSKEFWNKIFLKFQNKDKLNFMGLLRGRPWKILKGILGSFQPDCVSGSFVTTIWGFMGFKLGLMCGLTNN